MKFLNSLNKISGLGPQRLRLLLNFFETPENIWSAGLDNLYSSRVGEKLAERIYKEKNKIDPNSEWGKMKKEGIEMIALDDSSYPQLLKETNNPPYLLYTKGDITLLEEKQSPMVSIVGSRKHSPYGSQAVQSLAKNISRVGIIVVSGMAFGIDTLAHKATLEANGKTIAVLGNSLDEKSIYPRNNLGLSRAIAENGLLISEYPIETSAGALTFPARNRIIAGLSLGTLVVEAGEKSGALITAQMALEYNREVFAVPGSIFSNYAVGTNNLIKKGAKVVTSVKDILEEFNLDEIEDMEKPITKSPDTKEEKILLKILSSEPLHIDNISKISKLGSVTVSSTLLQMEIKGWAKNIGGQNYIIT